VTKEEHITYWSESALKDWTVALLLFKEKHFMYSMFFAHLALEKLLKAHWIKAHESNHPPKIHNLDYLQSKSKLKVADDDQVLLQMMNQFQIEGRYPAYKELVHQSLSQSKAENLLNDVNRIREWLNAQL
jgi:AbiV family abortive infection protein